MNLPNLGSLSSPPRPVGVLVPEAEGMCVGGRPLKRDWSTPARGKGEEGRKACRTRGSTSRAKGGQRRAGQGRGGSEDGGRAYSAGRARSEHGAGGRKERWTAEAVSKRRMRYADEDHERGFTHRIAGGKRERGEARKEGRKGNESGQLELTPPFPPLPSLPSRGFEVDVPLSTATPIVPHPRTKIVRSLWGCPGW